MKLREIGDLANLIAAVGVIISLLFVGYEIRQNTAETRASSLQTSHDGSMCNLSNGMANTLAEGTIHMGVRNE